MLRTLQTKVTCPKIPNKAKNSMCLGNQARMRTSADSLASARQVVVSQEQRVKLTVTYGNDIIPIFWKKRGWKQLQNVRARTQVQVRPRGSLLYIT